MVASFLKNDSRAMRRQPTRLYLRLRLHGRGFQSKRFHDLETALKTTRFRRVYTEPIQPLNPTVYVRAISFSGVRNIFKEPPVTSYRKRKSLKDTLVRA